MFTIIVGICVVIFIIRYGASVFPFLISLLYDIITFPLALLGGFFGFLFDAGVAVLLIWLGSLIFGGCS